MVSRRIYIHGYSSIITGIKDFWDGSFRSSTVELEFLQFTSHSLLLIGILYSTFWLRLKSRLLHISIGSQVASGVKFRLATSTI